MELLQPSYPPHHDPTRIGLTRSISSRLPHIVEDGFSNSSDSRNDVVYVCVGKSVDKAVSLLNWSFEKFESKEICLLYVHQPSPLIPTLLGKLPASQANAEVVSAYRREEREQMKKLLLHYLMICHGAKVEANIVTTECDHFQKGIVQLVNKHGVRKLVMGAAPDKCMKVKKSSSKANYVAKNAPSICEVWFINKGRNIWTREASDKISPLPENAGIFRSISLRYSENESPIHPESLRSGSTRNTSTRVGDCVQNGSACAGQLTLPPLSCTPKRCLPQTQISFRPSTARKSFDFDLNSEERSISCKLEELELEAEVARKKSIDELLRRKKLESEAIEAIGKIKIFESVNAHEAKLRKEAENALRNTMHEQEKLFQEKEEINRELQKAMRNVALLDSRAKQATRRRDEAAAELKVIQTSIASLRQEKQRIRQQKMEAGHWLERWKSRGQAGPANCSGLLGISEELPELAEFSLSDLQTATFNFSSSFKLGQGGFGCVYKGEMLGRTVAIQKLNAHNVQGQSEFQKEVQVLGKLQHRHLVTLLGACSEAWCLIYDYLPNGTLHNRLFQKSNISPLAWKDRARIIAEIPSALCFLHSSKPEKIVHGNLTPHNILLDSELSCKICDFGISRLVTDDILYCPSFRSCNEPKGAFPYTDPEYHRIGVMTPKSDIYAFGVIILQLLTGRSPVGLVSEVRRAMSCGTLALILDSSAGEWSTFVSERLANLAMQFCELNSRDRPELTPSLVRELEQLHVSEERQVPSFFLCPILQEIMHDPQVAADGFTYEGEAIRGWLENGRETSPMTNLNLPNLRLTPNHALRLAIQDWLCRS